MLVYVSDENSNNYKNVLRAAGQLKSDCNWYVMSGPEAEPHRKNGEDVVYFRQPYVCIHVNKCPCMSTKPFCRF